MAYDLIDGHRFCSNHRDSLSEDKVCGCFYCLKIFSPNEITNWLNEGTGTALCPYCTCDSVIGESSGYPITKEFLKEMNLHWFKDLK